MPQPDQPNRADFMEQALREIVQAAAHPSLTICSTDYMAEIARNALAYASLESDEQQPDEHCGYTPANCPWGDACADCGVAPRESRHTTNEENQ